MPAYLTTLRMIVLSSNEALLPNTPARLVARPLPGMQVKALTFSRFLFSEAGTDGGGKDWVIHDIEIDGVSQLEQKPLPGVLFSTRGIAARRGKASAHVTFEGLDVIERDSEVAVTVSYVGTNAGGAPFFGSIMGEAPPQRPTILPLAGKRLCGKATVVALFEAPVKVEVLEIDGVSIGGAADWLVHDARVDGVSQFKQPGTIPGDVFAITAIEGFIVWTPGLQVELDLEYVGHDPAEACFSGRLLCNVVRGDYTQAPPDVRAVVWMGRERADVWLVGEEASQEEVVARCMRREE